MKIRRQGTAGFAATAVFALATSALLAPTTASPQDPPDSLATESLPLEPTRQIRFTTNEGSWISVDISPDGATLVFDLLGDLYTLPVEGGTATPLMTGPAFESQPRYSPDGSEIVFVSDRSGGQNLWVLAADGSDTTQITRGNGNLYTSPERRTASTWSLRGPSARWAARPSRGSTTAGAGAGSH